MTVYDYNLTSPLNQINTGSLAADIEIDATLKPSVSGQTLMGVIFNEGEATSNLHIEFDSALSAGEETQLTTLVNNRKSSIIQLNNLEGYSDYGSQRYSWYLTASPPKTFSSTTAANAWTISTYPIPPGDYRVIYGGQYALRNPAKASILSGLANTTILYQAGSGYTRYTFSGSPNLSTVQAGDVLDVSGDANAENNGRHEIKTVNDGSDYIEVKNYSRTDTSKDVSGDSAATSLIDSPREGKIIFQLEDQAGYINNHIYPASTVSSPGSLLDFSGYMNYFVNTRRQIWWDLDGAVINSNQTLYIHKFWGELICVRRTPS